LPKAKSEIVWLINYIDHSLADRRNDVIHSPFSFMTDNSGTRLKSDFFSENPRAIKLFEKELLAEFTWYQHRLCLSEIKLAHTDDEVRQETA
jgi:hypothetical protein